MLTTRFDHLVATLAATGTRRRLLQRLTLSAGLGALNLTAGEAKQRKAKKRCFLPCGLCTTCLYGKCRPKKRGTSCGRGLVCHDGTCACDDTSCSENQICVNGACVIPTGT
jgi:hypothetical protein